MTILTGRGILKLIRIPVSFNLSVFLSPTITLSFWILCLGWGLLLKFSLKEISLIIWILTILLAFIGMLENFKKINQKNHWILLISILLLPVFAMFPYFWNGIFIYGGFDAPDGWSYAAIGQFLWEHPLGTLFSHDAPTLYQYATHIVHERFISSALLGFLSPVTGHPGDSQLSINLFIALSLFIFSSGCAFFAVTQNLGKWTPWYLSLVIISGWIFGLLTTNNFDNGIILSFLPIFAGVMTLMHANKYKWTFVLSLFFAATIYSYPEMSPILLSGLIIMFLCESSNNLKKWEYSAIVFLILLISIMLIIPFCKDGIIVFLSRFDAVMNTPQGVRPGEGYFTSLLGNHLLTAFWGFKSYLLCKLLAITLTALSLLGVSILWREQKQGMLLLGILLLFATAFLIFQRHYSYGAYKFILLNWWFLCFCIIKGVDWINRVTERFNKQIMLGFFVLWVAYISTNYLRLSDYLNHNVIPDMRVLRQVSNIKNEVHDKTTLLAINNDAASLWAVYYLRNISTQLVTFRSYLHYLEQPVVVSRKNVSFLLTDNPASKPKENLLWAHGPYYLWKL